LLILYPLALFLVRARLQLAGFDAFPLVLFAVYAAIMVLAPIPAHHDSTDLTQRPFVLLYAVVAVWTAASLIRWALGTRHPQQAGYGKPCWSGPR
jgi:hypothetical protein